MMQIKARRIRLALMAAIAGMIIFTADARASMDVANSDRPGRSDVININAMTTFGPIERPPVEFLHDKHTQAVGKRGKDCLACHPQDDATGRMSIKYMRFGNTGRQEVMDIYHAGCISCHDEQLSSGKASGPVECGECHAKEVKTVSNLQPFGMDKSLHYRHIEAEDGRCDTCHHEYDAATKKLVYVKHQEGSCRYCHPEKAEDNRMSMREASHIACVGCHRRLTAQGKLAGPIECAGCHNAERQAMIVKLADVPRLKMYQPSAVFVKTQAAGSAETEAVRMNPVPFDHRAHETYNDTCRVCHHANLKRCADCHTVQGSKEGAWVTLGQAMHRNGAAAACVGCHEQKQMDNACAGCHGFMIRSRQMPQEYCNSCHPAPPAGDTANAAEQATATSAAETLAARAPATGTYDLSDIPETVTIKSLSKTYEPVELPHRKIVAALVKGIGNNKLAGYFHTEQGTLCQGCHHNSPATREPPQCTSCHGKPFQEGDLYRPGLMAAYHQQCMGCHDQMGIEQPASKDCTACHKEKQGNTLISDPNS